jgi:hypothetical protein
MAKISSDVMAELGKVLQQTVKVPVLGAVIVRGMTGEERDEFEATLITGKGRNRDVNMKNMRAKLVSYCVVDEHGERIFSDVAALGKIRADILNKLFTVAQKLSGISEEDADELGQASK